MELITNLGICFGLTVEGLIDPFISATVTLIGDLTGSAAIKRWDLDNWFGMGSYDPDYYNPYPGLPYCPGFGPPVPPEVQALG